MYRFFPLYRRAYSLEGLLAGVHPKVVGEAALPLSAVRTLVALQSRLLLPVPAGRHTEH